MNGPFPTGQQETFIGVPGAPQHGHVVWHEGLGGPVYDFVRDAQGNVYANTPSGLFRFLGDIAINGR
jgi:hypothetical protein